MPSPRSTLQPRFTGDLRGEKHNYDAAHINDALSSHSFNYLFIIVPWLSMFRSQQQQQQQRISRNAQRRNDVRKLATQTHTQQRTDAPVARIVRAVTTSSTIYTNINRENCDDVCCSSHRVYM